MKTVIVFAGTTEGRRLAEGFASMGIKTVVSVATEYGELVLKDDPLMEIHMGRLSIEEMVKLISEEKALTADKVKVFDATHPFATEVTKNIKEACKEADTEYIRILREAGEKEGYLKCRYFDSVEEAFNALSETKGNILLTTGSKDLKKLPEDENLISRIYARVLPSVESIELCNTAGISGEHIIAIQGPFDVEMNKALIQRFDIKTLVTKESGRTGGYGEKIQASKEKDIDVFVVGRPNDEDGITVEEALKEENGMDSFKDSKISLGEIKSSENKPGGINPSKINPSEIESNEIKVSLVGIGPGNRELMTLAGVKAIENADIVCGAKRMIEEYRNQKETYPFYLAKDVIALIDERKPSKIAVLFSGDSSFYSGAEKMKKGLEEFSSEKGLGICAEVIPGISSLSYFAAKIGEAYSESIITSIHGKKEEESLEKLIQYVKEEEKVFTLLSGVEDVRRICQALIKNDLGEALVTLGYSLSYEDEMIISFSPGEEPEGLKEGLYVALIRRKK